MKEGPTTKFVDFDAFTGIETWVTADEESWTVVERSRADEIVKEHNAADEKEHSDYGPTRWKGDFHHVARIHPLAYAELMRECDERGLKGKDRNKYILRWLDGEKGKAWRTKPGSLSR